MTKLRSSLLNLSKERIYETLVKIVNCPFFNRAFESLVETQIHQVLPSLDSGIELLAQLKLENMNLEVFFAVCFALKKKVDTYYPFPSKLLHLLKTTISLLPTFNPNDDFILYTYGAKMVIFVSRVKSIIESKFVHSATNIYDRYTLLPIKSELDIAVRPKQLIELANKKEGAWVGQIMETLTKLILNKELNNNAIEIIDYLYKEKLL
jgi:tRNA nucleotidyltransferase (CCA-adding enzyme)